MEKDFISKTDELRQALLQTSQFAETALRTSVMSLMSSGAPESRDPVIQCWWAGICQHHSQTWEEAMALLKCPGSCHEFHDFKAILSIVGANDTLKEVGERALRISRFQFAESASELLPRVARRELIFC